MPETIKSIKWTKPVQGTSSSNATIVVGSETVGGEETLLIAEMTTRELLEGILITLKKIDLRQQEVFEETVNDGDV
jgi:pyocin large subunit-like protein